MKLMFLGRGPIAQCCLAECRPALAVMDPVRHNEGWMLDCVLALEVDAIISVQYPWIVSSALLDAVRGNAFNLHNARLPDYRGHHCMQWALAKGDTVYTSTIHRMVAAVDRGDIVAEAQTEVRPGESAESLYWRTIPACVQMFRAFMARLTSGMPIVGRPQGDGGRFYGKFETVMAKVHV